MDVPCRIRTARHADVRPLAELEQRCFSDPWSAMAFAEVVAAPGGVALVAERADAVIGYFIAREVLGTAEILNLAVDPGHRRAGVARALLDAGLAALRGRGAQEIFLEVRASNEAAQALYRGSGFVAVGRRRGYYRRPAEDALVLALVEADA